MEVGSNDGRRMAKLREVLGKALDCAIEDAAENDFANSYDPSLNINARVLKTLSNSMLQNIGSNVKVLIMQHGNSIIKHSSLACNYAFVSE